MVLLAATGLRENAMFRLNLGSGASAFEVEGEADLVRSVSPDELVERNWPAEMVENIRQYQARLKRTNLSSRFDTEAQATADLAETNLFEAGIGTAADDQSG
jgi:hypothetical protein